MKTKIVKFSELDIGTLFNNKCIKTGTCTYRTENWSSIYVSNLDTKVTINMNEYTCACCNGSGIIEEESCLTCNGIGKFNYFPK